MSTMNAPAIDRRQLTDRRGDVHARIGGAISAIDYIALALMIVGGLNWAMVALFQVDVVASLFGAGTPLARVIYILVGVAALWGVYLVVRLASKHPRP
ncbi:MAG: DUF378 domain-containing protein [Pseudomonadota bacterium]|nr:DUF378 domain-containing protein [Pseudomonadota bacterium]